jgi:hypothetical protein
MAAMKRHIEDSWDELNETDGFDVVCVVGHVSFDPTANQTPYEAAFALIARHGATGTFTFPDGNEFVTVTVERQ